MVSTIIKWLLVIIGIKLIVVLITIPFTPDPRRDLAVREEMYRKFNPNAVFIGTSRTLYALDSRLFDSLNRNETRTYNMGLFNLPASQAFNIAERIIERDTAVRNIFIELSALDYNTILLSPTRVLPDFVFRTKVMAGCSTIEVSDKIESFLAGLNTSLYQMLSIAPQIVLAKKAMRTSSDPIEGTPWLRPDGHQPVNLGGTNQTAYIHRSKKSTAQMMAARQTKEANQYYIDQINGLILSASKRKKKITFCFPNNLLHTEFLILSQVAPYIPEHNLIRLPADSRFEALFDPGNSFDAHHLNQQGAKIYTRFLQEEFSKRSHPLTDNI
ncbi:hypothetical protein [Dyadobacter sp. Leaf189]|uniref:hypothetical protein n=1 Tax=Dyadobacter sp. Leaf189 TaxID=1736295 RepID=UPI0006F263C3|nr:hypothetical protein [Dyadobacter sp. Leaf189]KQS23892.1 hypothetical protein ASG33_25095 [Dyadobacter sp. Leaf189]